jgi:hypothetical protein
MIFSVDHLSKYLTHLIPGIQVDPYHFDLSIRISSHSLKPLEGKFSLKHVREKILKVRINFLQY